FVLLFLVLLGRLVSIVFPYTTLFRSGITWKRSFVFITPRHEIRSEWRTRTFIPRPIWILSSENCWRGSSRAGLQTLIHSRSSNRSEEHTSELQSLRHLVCPLLPEKKK